MKILRIVSSGYEEGGVENGIVLTKPLFEADGHTVKIFSSDARGDLPHFNDYSYRSPGNSIFSKFLHTFNFYAYFELKKVLKDFKPDIVCVHTIGDASPAVLLLLRKIPTIYMVHGPEYFIKSLRAWCFPVYYFRNNEHSLNNLNIKGVIRHVYFMLTDRITYHFGLKNVDMFITLSNYMHNLLENDGIKNTYVPYGTRLMKYEPLDINNIHDNILYVGRLEVFKGVDYLINAMPKIVKLYPEVVLTIAGDGSQRKNLEKLVKELSLEKSVKFVGHVNRGQIENLYKNNTILIVPSVWDEAFGKIGVEAMSVGRPVIASNVGGISDWLKDGVNGYLIPPKNSDKILESVVKLLQDKKMLSQMASNARKISEDFDISIHVKKMEEIFTKIVSQGKKK